ncbi:fimbrial protein [Burkholderia ubonensis]|uniref:fimbrial protein n=1 Tax=Burkholderia ubonensis TaxID=101571 RepID=UPI0012FA92D5|nr:fimbrial protein [Burkholderia ubonensis]
MEKPTHGLSNLRGGHMSSRANERILEGSDVKKIFTYCLTVILISASGIARAACNFTNSKSELVVNFNLPAEITVKPGTKVGTVLAEATFVPDTVAFAYCTPPGRVNRSVYGGARVDGGVVPYIYATNIPGIGLAFYDDHKANGMRYWGKGDDGNHVGWWSWGESGTSTKLGVKVILTGSVGVGDIPAGAVYAKMTLDGLGVAILRTNGTKIKTPACSVPSINVDMGAIKMNEFSGPSSTAGDRSFDIQLNSCPPGRNAIYYQFDATTQIVPGAGNSVVQLNGSSSASGIGLQLLDASGNPVPFGAASKFSGYSGQSGSYTMPFRARYYQIAPTVTPGTANTAITITMSYE